MPEYGLDIFFYEKNIWTQIKKDVYTYQQHYCWLCGYTTLAEKVSS